MTTEDRLRLHLGGKDVTWRTEGTTTLALWTEDGAQHAAILVPPPPTAASIVDAFLVARPTGARLTLVHDAPLSPTALRSASRFGLRLLDASTLPEPTPAAPPAPEPEAQAPAPTVVLADVVVPIAPAPEPFALAPEMPAPTLLPAPGPTPLLLPAHEEPLPALPGPAPAPEAAEPAAEPDPAPIVAVELAAPELFAPQAGADVDAGMAAIEPLAPLLPEPAPEAAVGEPDAAAVEVEPLPAAAPGAPIDVAPSGVEAAVAVEVEVEVATVEVAAPVPVAAPDEPAHAEAPVAVAPIPAEVTVPLLEPGFRLPWEIPATAAPPAAPATTTVNVSAAELAALPWHAHAPIEEHVEVMPGNARPRRFADRPTTRPPDAGATWGLPWPRPVVPTDGLSVADPRIWSAQERVHAVREELDARLGAASFGAVKPDGSPWIKRIQTFGSP